MVHDFKTSLDRVAPEEKRLDEYLMKKGWSVTYVNLIDQRRGIDRVIEKPNELMTVEYKVDYRAAKTGNAYIETVSISKPFKFGWVHTCKADWILYTVIGDKSTVLWLRPEALLKNLPEWEKSYKTVRCQNRDYYGEGVLVSLSEIRKLAAMEECLDGS